MENEQPLFEYGQSSSGLFNSGGFNLHFNPNGFYNGKNSWISDDLTIKIIWDTTLNGWKLSGDSLGDIQVINKNPSYPPINGNWTVLWSSYSVKSNQGVCPPLNLLSMTTNFNNPGCTCDGSINVSATGGVPPYSYSYDGASYINSPIIDELCGGIYSVNVKDSEGTIVTKTITIDEIKPTINYTANLNVISTSMLSKTMTRYMFEVVIDPPLPDGVQVKFDMDLFGTFMRTPFINSANSTFTPTVIKNDVPIVGVDNTNQTFGSNPYPGCQGYNIYNTNYSFKYNNLTITNDDVYVISVVTNYQLTCANQPPSVLESISENGLGPLTFDLEDYATSYRECCKASFTVLPTNSNIGNKSISGCNCCTISQSYTKSLYE